jgi:hypothetical protein
VQARDEVIGFLRARLYGTREFLPETIL